MIAYLRRQALPDQIDSQKLAAIASSGAAMKSAQAASGTDGRPAFTGARKDLRTFRGFDPPHRHGDTATRGSYDTLQPRMRDMVENDPQMKRPCDKLVNMMAGKGPLVLSMATLPTSGRAEGKALVPKLDIEFILTSNQHFERWSKKTKFKRLMKLSFREWINTGNVLLKRYRLEDGAPAWQLIEVEQLNRMLDRARGRGQNEISHGIEYAADGVTPVAYHFYKSHPEDGHALVDGQQSERIPAEQVLHLYIPTRGSMRFGIPWHQAMMKGAMDGDFLVGTELTSAAVAALFTAVITSLDDDLGSDSETQLEDAAPNEDAYGNSFKKLGAGTVARIRPGEDVKTVTSGRPNKNVSDFLKFLWLLNSQATNLSYFRMTGDLSGATYTSLRAAMLDDEQYIVPLQDEFFETIVEPIRKAVDEWGVGTGEIPISAARYLTQIDRYQTYVIVGPGQDWLQPDQEVEATKMAIAAGLTSLPIECGKWGRNWFQNLLEMAMVNQVCDDLGVALDFGKGNGGKAEENTTAKKKKKQPGKEAA